MLESDIQRAGAHPGQQRGVRPGIYRYVSRMCGCCRSYTALSVATSGKLYFLLLFFLDYHVVADGYGGKGYLVRREDESRLTDIVRQAQKEAQEGKAVLLNVLIGKTNFREGSISV